MVSSRWPQVLRFEPLSVKLRGLNSGLVPIPGRTTDRWNRPIPKLCRSRMSGPERGSGPEDWSYLDAEIPSPANIKRQHQKAAEWEMHNLCLTFNSLLFFCGGRLFSAKPYNLSSYTQDVWNGPNQPIPLGTGVAWPVFKIDLEKYAQLSNSMKLMIYKNDQNNVYLNLQRTCWSEHKPWFWDSRPSFWILANRNYENWRRRLVCYAML